MHRALSRVFAAITFACVLGVATSALAEDLVVQSINTSSFPNVEIRLALPPDMVTEGASPKFQVVENGVPRAVSKSAPEDGSVRGAIDVALVLDTSGSMKGDPLEHAKAAARQFVAEMGSNDRVAIVTIGGKPTTLVGFTSDKLVLDGAIAGLSAGGDTALYDALVKAAALFDDSPSSQRYVVLLSDGGDTVSSASLDKAVDKMSAVSAPIYAVALSSRRQKPEAVQALARSTQGSMLATDEAAKLTEIFSAIAEEIQTTWLVSYRSADPPAPDLEIVLTARARGMDGKVITTADNPTFESTKGQPWQVRKLSPLFRVAGWTIALMVGLSIGLAVTGTALILRREGSAIDQLEYYDHLRASRFDGAQGDADGSGIRSRLQGAVAQVAGERGFTADLKVRLQRAGFIIRPNEFIYLHLVTVIVIGALTRIGTGSALVAVTAVALATILPLWYLDFAARRRTARFEADLPDIVSLIAGSLRSGWGIQQALDLIVEETREPAASEFRRVQSETRLGLSLEESLGRMADRLQSVDFTWVVSAIGIQREVGGNLAEVLDIAAGAIRERAELRREVVALTAEGRFSAIILVALPFLMFAGLLVVAPKYASALTSTFYGVVLLVSALVMLLVGGLWLFRVSKVEV